jgi:hypothetical protein
LARPWWPSVVVGFLDNIEPDGTNFLGAMMNRLIRRSIGAVAVATVVALGVPTTTVAATATSYVEGTDAAAVLFDPAKVSDVDLTLSPTSLQNLTQEMCNGGEYQPGTLTLRYNAANGTLTTIGPMTVGIRLKGCIGSFRDLGGKAGWKIKLNQVSGQTLLGLKRLTLNNNVQDASMIHQALSYRVFRSMGVAAPRVGFTTVSLNGNEYGLYSNVETLDKVALVRWYGDGGTKHLYEGQYGQDATVGRTDEFEIDEGNSNRADLEALAEANELSGEAWWNAVRPLADLNQMTAMWATEFYLGHWDGYITRNNYYLHSDASGKFTMLPWGTDQTFSWEPSYGMEESPQGILFHRCFEVPACTDLYVANLRKIHRDSSTLKMPAMATAVSTAIAASAEADPRREMSFESVTGDQESTRNWITNRPQSILNWINANLPDAPQNAVSREGRNVVQTWIEPDSSSFTIDHYQVGIRKGRSWTYRKTTDTRFTTRQVGRQRLSMKVRAHSSVGYGAWSATVTPAR